MYELTIEREFCAAHALAIGGEREPVHGHNWRVRVHVEGDALDDDGLVCDFHEVERHLDEVLGPFRDADLNRTPPFDEVNPSAEHVARHIFEQMAARMAGAGVPGPAAAAAISRVSVTEAPGCAASYRMSTR